MDLQSNRQPLWQFVSRDESLTVELGRRIGAGCRGGELILLDGPLGAGKTRLAGGVAAGLGIEEPTPSPTFVIMRAYRGSRGLWLYHFDLYRLGGAEELETVGLEDCLAPDAVVLVEWPGRCPEALKDFTLALRLEITGETERRIGAWPGPAAVPESLGRTDLLPPS